MPCWKETSLVPPCAALAGTRGVNRQQVGHAELRTFGVLGPRARTRWPTPSIISTFRCLARWLDVDRGNRQVGRFGSRPAAARSCITAPANASQRCLGTTPPTTFVRPTSFLKSRVRRQGRPYSKHYTAGHALQPIMENFFRV